MEGWDIENLDNFAFINPTEKLAKGTMATKVAMTDLQPFTKKIQSFSIEPYNGGMKFRNGDTLVARITPCIENGKSAYVDVLKEDEIGFGSTEYIVLRQKSNSSNKQYLYYFSQSDIFRRIAIKSMTGTSGRQRVQTDVVRNTEFYFPPLPEQKAIAGVLSALDDKIDLLHRQNKTLEALAETLFRQWFIEEAEDNWEEGELGDILTMKGGSTPSTKNEDYWGGDIHWTTPRDLSNSASLYLLDTARKITKAGLNKITSGLLPKGTLLMSSRAPVGYLALSEVPISINQGYIAILDNKGFSKYFIYLWLKLHMPYVKSFANGSTFQEISKASFKTLEIVIPPKLSVEKFTTKIEPNFTKIKANTYQIQTLENLRDTLLPKLMSGAVRVRFEDAA
ncbi:MAG: restriction endonuclease subunit S [Robiginitomaculum sp.]|nr:MAG: restriction endonuclease subunit S [Robiginitomaculum sp.]